MWQYFNERTGENEDQKLPKHTCPVRRAVAPIRDLPRKQYGPRMHCRIETAVSSGQRQYIM